MRIFNLKWILPLVAIAIAFAGMQFLIQSKPKGKKHIPSEKIWQVELAPLTASSLSPTLQISGVVESPDTLNAAAPGASWVKQVLVKEGDLASKGDLLIGLDRRDFEVNVRQAEAEIADVDAQIAEAEVQYEMNEKALGDERQLLALVRKSVDRAKQLSAKSLGSASALDTAQQDYKRQQLAVNQRQLAVNSYDSRQLQLRAQRLKIQAQLEQAELAMERSQIVAPYDGVVSAVSVSAGDRVNIGQSLLTLYALGELEVRAKIPLRYEVELNPLAANAPEIIAFDARGQQFVLRRLSGIASTSGIDGFFAPSAVNAALKPGTSVTLNILRPLKPDVYVIPYESIYGENRIYLFDQGRLEAVTVETVGPYINADGQSRRLVRSDAINAGDQLVITRLPNATSGLKVADIAAEKPKQASQAAKPVPES